MKKIIKGKKYDTETATLIGSDSSGIPSDFSWWEETLYRKRTGEFFLHGAGGPMTKYAESCGQNSWGYGEHIEPLSVKTAMEWAEKHLRSDEYEACFGDVSEDDSKKIVTYSLPERTIEKLKVMAAESGRSMSDIVALAIELLEADKL